MKTFSVDIEQVRKLAEAQCLDEDSALDFWVAAMDLGATEEEADRIDQLLTVRVMTARGAL
jgi:hypothetical protein